MIGKIRSWRSKRPKIKRLTITKTKVNINCISFSLTQTSCIEAMTSVVIEAYKKLRLKMAIEKNKTNCFVKFVKSNESFIKGENETEDIETI